MYVTDALIAPTTLQFLIEPGPVFAAQQLAPQDLSDLTLLSTAAAQQEDLSDCLASFSKSNQAKTEHLYKACKDAVSAFKSEESCRTQNVTGYVPAATAVARAVQAALRSESASSCNTHVILGRDVSANVREETNQFTQSLYKSSPADFWESMMNGIEAIKAATSVVLSGVPPTMLARPRSDTSNAMHFSQESRCSCTLRSEQHLDLGMTQP